MKFFQRREVVSALHASAKSESWQECTGRVGQQLHNSNSNASIALFPSLLQRIEILLFAGDQDLICNHLGIEMLIDALEWNGDIGLGVSFDAGFNIWLRN